MSRYFANFKYRELELAERGQIYAYPALPRTWNYRRLSLSDSSLDGGSMDFREGPAHHANTA